MLKIYNSLSHQKEIFQSIAPNAVGMYVCGMTVYDYCHVGHARVMVVFDTIYRYLQASGYDVTYIRNITDIDDKIIQRALQNDESIQALTERFITAMHEDADALGVLRPTAEPRATESIDAILNMIQTLIDKQYAYLADNGDVYYAVNAFDGYGKLSGKQLDDLQAGARVEIGEQKRDPLDFVLWKASKVNEPAWDSPWGLGRPGWHIECSAMSTAILGKHFDIHGGGQDLQFPHHENEIAQSEACHDSQYVNYWVHNGFVRVNEEKMSKSLGNFFTVREVLQLVKPEVLRYFILTSHYRSQLNYSDENLQNATAALTRLYTALRDVQPLNVDANFGVEQRMAFKQAMDDDFNTPIALSVLFELVTQLNQSKKDDADKARQLAGLILELAEPLGILRDDPEQFLQSGTENGEGTLSSTDIDALVKARMQARESKDWMESDRIRDLLKDSGVILEDSTQGTKWRRNSEL